MDETRLAEIEARSLRAVPKCNVCNATARWTTAAYRMPEDFCEACMPKSRFPLSRIQFAELDSLDLVAEVRRLTAALATVTAERDALRSAAEEREMDMHQRIRAGYDRTIADSWRAEVVRAVAAERDVLRAEHAVALATARREGAEEARVALEMERATKRQTKRQTKAKRVAKGKGKAKRGR